MSAVEKLMSIKEDIGKYKNIVKGPWDMVLENEVSKYPILVYSPMPFEAGVLLIDRGDAPGPWSVNISTLEEFSIKGLVQQEKIEEFINVYKDPSEFFCAFVISDLGAQFLFFPQ